ncbi:MAG: single-stranded DNA-binding protein, partial [Firmicutes bacterium HGW-Firmicutes-21]
MASFNKVILLGYLTETPELKKTQSGVSVTSFRIGVSRKVVKDADQKTDFINIICWRERAEFVCRNFTKGNAILVCGSLQTRSWLDNDVKRYTTEVVADEV